MSENERKIDLIYGELLNRCWQDEAYLKRFRAEPKEVLAEAGLPVRADAAYHVMEQSQDRFFIILPQNYPAEKMEKLDDLKAEVKAQAGLREGAVIEVVQNSDTDVYLPYYAAPKFKPLSDDEMAAAAGGIHYDPDPKPALSMESAWAYEQDYIAVHSLVATEIITLVALVSLG